jgi:hypothetical protein
MPVAVVGGGCHDGGMTTPSNQPTADDWKRLGKAIADRRFRLDLSQEALVKRGGPSHQTVRNIERGIPAEYRATTFRKFDRALNWPDGTTRKILDDTATEEDLIANVMGGTGSASLDRLVAGTEGEMTRGRGFTPSRRSGLTVGQVVDLAERGEPLPPEVVEMLRDTNRRVSETIGATLVQLRGNDAVTRSLARDLVPVTASIAEVMKGIIGPGSVFEQFSSTIANINNEPVMRAFAELRNGPVLQAFADLQNGPLQQTYDNLSRIALPPVDVSSILGLPENITALAFPPLPPETLSMFDEFDRKADAIAAEPWYDDNDDITIAEALGRYNEAHPEESTVEYRHGEAHDEGQGVDTADVAAVTYAEVKVTADTKEPSVAEIIPLRGRWGAVFLAQQEVGDVKDTALAAELLARVSRLPDSEERRTQLRVLNGLVEEFLDKQAARQQGARPNHQPRIPWRHGH